MASDPVRGDLDHQSRLHAVTHLTLDDLRKVDAMTEPSVEEIERVFESCGEDTLRGFVEVLLASWRWRGEIMRAKCEAIARLHQTYHLPDFPAPFNGAYQGAARNIGDAIASLKDKP